LFKYVYYKKNIISHNVSKDVAFCCDFWIYNYKWKIM